MATFAVIPERGGGGTPSWVIVVFDDMGVRPADGFPPFARECDAQAFADDLNDRTGGTIRRDDARTHLELHPGAPMARPKPHIQHKI